VFEGPRVLVHHGSAAGLSASATTTLTVDSPLSSPLVGRDFEDLNGDGYDDLTLTWRSCTKDCVSTITELQVFTGSPEGLDLQPRRKRTSRNEDRSSYVAAAGGVDGDGHGDMALSVLTDSDGGAGQPDEV
jgi:hypothetical protein